MAYYKILDWDSKFFKFTVAKIINTRPTLSDLKEILRLLKTQGVKLVYWPAESLWDQDVISALSGQLVDIKTTYVLDLAKGMPEKLDTSEVSKADEDLQDIDDLEDLAIQSGEYSRFALDPNISKEIFFNLYKIWMRKSLSKEIAQEVLLIRQPNKIAGMVTLGEKFGRGDIGLIAVDRQFRGNNYGKKLVYASRDWLVSQEYSEAQVVTQGNNLAACKLYEKCGYSVETVEYYYHFWLQ